MERADAYAQQAQALTDAGDNKGALDAINRAIALRDDNPTYFLLLGAIELRANDPVNGFKAFKRVLELDATNVNALTYVSNLGLQVGQVKDASDAADRLLALNPNSLVGLQVKGLVEVLTGHLDAARGYSDRILALSPSDEAGTIVRARVLAKSGKYDEALALVDNAMVIVGPTPALLITKLNLFRVLRRPDDMAAAFDQILPIIKNQSMALRLDQINLLYKIGQTDKARKQALAFLAVGSIDPNDYRILQRIWWEFDPTPLSVESVKLAKQWPDPLALVAVGRYLLWHGNPQRADDLYFAVRPGIQPIGIAIHIRAVFGMGRVEEARRGVDLILQRDTEDVDALMLRAHFRQQDGQSNLAIEAAQKAVDSDPYDPETYVVLADLFRAAGSNWRATQVYEDGLKALQQDFMLVDKYTQFLHELRDKSRAVSVARAFTRAMPASVKAWSNLAAQCRWANDNACVAEAEKGRQNAQTSYRVDGTPGAPADRGLLGEF
ncbi:MAG TPA: tetratricopeptide repeat protein [Sphingomonas sp.]|nr:tetratricopeptide repeat protein [Sphingomonas sp.]